MGLKKFKKNNMTNNVKEFLFKTLLLFVIVSIPTLAGCSTNELPNSSTPVEDEKGNEWVIYEVYPGLYGHQNAFNEIANRLDELSELGVNVIWLMPIYEQGVVKAIGSPYSIKNYKKLNSDYGTLEELKSLVSNAQARGMKVILDWVANHTSWDNLWIENKDWYTQDANGNIVSPPGMNWEDVADLNFSNIAMRKAMIEAMKYWVIEVGVDGYRCDYAEGVPGDFWEEAIVALKEIKKDDLLMLAEGGKAELFSFGFDIVYGWDFAYKLKDLYSGKITVNGLYESHRKEYEQLKNGQQRMRYSTNHDMSSDESPIKSFNGEKGALSAFVISITMGGTPMIYSSQEIGYDRPLSFFRQNVLDWNSNPTYTAQYKKIMNIYSSSEALKKGKVRTFNTPNVVCVLRASQNEKILVVVNTTNEAIEIKTPIEFAYSHAENLLDKVSLTLTSLITLEPYQFSLYKIK